MGKITLEDIRHAILIEYNREPEDISDEMVREVELEALERLGLDWQTSLAIIYEDIFHNLNELYRFDDLYALYGEEDGVMRAREDVIERYGMFSNHNLLANSLPFPSRPTEYFSYHTYNKDVEKHLRVLDESNIPSFKRVLYLENVPLNFLTPDHYYDAGFVNAFVFDNFSGNGMVFLEEFIEDILDVIFQKVFDGMYGDTLPTTIAQHFIEAVSDSIYETEHHVFFIPTTTGSKYLFESLPLRILGKDIDFSKDLGFRKDVADYIIEQLMRGVTYSFEEVPELKFRQPEWLAESGVFWDYLPINVDYINKEFGTDFENLYFSPKKRYIGVGIIEYCDVHDAPCCSMPRKERIKLGCEGGQYVRTMTTDVHIFGDSLHGEEYAHIRGMLVTGLDYFLKNIQDSVFSAMDFWREFNRDE